MSLQARLASLLVQADLVRVQDLIAPAIVRRVEAELRSAHMVELDPGVWCPTERTAAYVEAHLPEPEARP